MAAEPAAPGPDAGPYEVIHLGGQAAVVVPVADFLRLRALERAASPRELEDAEDTAAMLEWKARDAAGQTSYVPHDEARRRHASGDKAGGSFGAECRVPSSRRGAGDLARRTCLGEPPALLSHRPGSIHWRRCMVAITSAGAISRR